MRINNTSEHQQKSMKIICRVTQIHGHQWNLHTVHAPAMPMCIKPFSQALLYSETHV